MKKKFLIFASGRVTDVMEGRRSWGTLGEDLKEFILKNCLVLAKAKQFEKVTIIHDGYEVHFDIGFVTVEVTL